MPGEPRPADTHDRGRIASAFSESSGPLAWREKVRAVMQMMRTMSAPRLDELPPPTFHGNFEVWTRRIP